MIMAKNSILDIYKWLLNKYGPQGWWPLINEKTLLCEYHPEDYSYPQTEEQRFEICCGSILTQSINWTSVEKALSNLKKLDALRPEKLLALDDKTLTEAIRPAGYFNQKAKKLRTFTEFFISLKGTPARQQLLYVWGVGKETADSMLLYAFKIPTFVIDVYTRRIFANLELIDKDAEYDTVKALFEDNIKPDLIIYQEYHALIVEHAKRFYRKDAENIDCPLCRYFKKQ